MFLISDYCNSRNPNVQNGANGRSLGFAIQTTSSMFLDIAQIKSNIQNTINTIEAQSPNWITIYILVTFNDQSMFIP